MTEKPVPTRVKRVFRLSAWQLFFTSLASGIVFVLAGSAAAKSVFLGALCVVIPHSVFTWYLFRFNNPKQLQLILKSMYRGETLKLIITAMMVIAVFKNSIVVPWLFFAGFTFALLIQLAIPILINYDNWD